ncbi:circadian protein clock [Holotrichia oblita]|uniref:Circadian protein clock n=1 Tax=Holotrichia oblita TaxID=644536 RepID=A0ACB9TVY4_HOLOL|nr:circadian protein clock [Holotrichia oblita]
MSVHSFQYSRLSQNPDEDSDFSTLQEQKPASVESYSPQQYRPTYFELHNVYDNPIPSTSRQYPTPSSSTVNVMELHHVDNSNSSIKKRKTSTIDPNETEEETGDDAKSTKTADDNKKQNHSEIEKRRRDKMNTYISELSTMVPMCSAMSRKLDKLTVLRMAVQHLKTIRGTTRSYTEGLYKAPYLTEQDLKRVILQADLLGQSVFDILHPKDVAKVKEQLSSPDMNPRERLIDAKNKKYNVIHCTGYLKSWPPGKVGLEEQESDRDAESCTLPCLVAFGRILPHISTIATAAQNYSVAKTIEFTSRHSLDGKFLFVDQRATLVLGFLPQELIGTSMYEYFHHDDVSTLAECHKCALQSAEKISTGIYRFKTKTGDFVRLQSEWKAFKNPWTNEIEYMTARNNLLLADFNTVESTGIYSESLQESFDFFTPSNSKEMQRLIQHHIEASKIGRQIAEELIDTQRCADDASPVRSMESRCEPNIQTGMHDPQLSTGYSSQQSLNQNIYEFSQTRDTFSQYTHTAQSSGSVSTVAQDLGGNAEDGMMEIMGDTVHEPPTNTSSTDGNDEAAMAVIMSLLEADAGLGGPVDFSGLPWPLP